jgi:hypothetical protein
MKLEKATNVAMIITCATIVARLIPGVYQTIVPPAAVRPYKPGERLTSTKALTFTTASQTLILITASNCHFCTESMPFYRTLVDQAHAVGARLVAATAEPLDMNRQYLRSNGVNVDDVISSIENGLRFRGTPTLVLVSSNGEVVNAWDGKLPEDKEREVFATLARAPKRNS